MRIFITGGNGFIGVHLKTYLIQKGYKVFAPSSREVNLLRDVEVEKAIDNFKPDIIIHAANRGGTRDTVNMENVVEYNLRMFFNIYRFSGKVSKIITLGSGAEYGKHKPIVEAKEENVGKELPCDAYGFYKYIISQFAERTKNLVHLRVFGCFGEGENVYIRFISNAIVKNLLHLPIVINRNVIFDYIYVKDLVRIIEYFVLNETRWNVYNATRGIGIDLYSLAKIINNISDFKSEIIILNKGYGNEYTSDNSRLKQEIKDLSFTPYEKAIKDMSYYYINHLDSIDVERIKADPYLRLCDTLWKRGRE